MDPKMPTVGEVKNDSQKEKLEPNFFIKHLGLEELKKIMDEHQREA